MSEYRTLVCDRCGAEKKRESYESWNGWHEKTSVTLDGITRLYSGFPDFKWNGTLCGDCSGEIDEAVRALFEPRSARSTPDTLGDKT